MLYNVETRHTLSLHYTTLSNINQSTITVHPFDFNLYSAFLCQGMDIIYVKNRAIDQARWDATVSNDAQGLPYVYSWYLDNAASGQWDALITPDYQYIMPLPWNRKFFGIKQIFAPLLTQQLGVAGPDVSKEITVNFLNKIPHKFKKIVYPLNQQIDHPECRTKTNLVISLTDSYEKIQEGYKKNLVRGIRTADTKTSINESLLIDDLLTFYQQTLKKQLTFSKKDWQIIRQLLQSASQQLETLMLEVRNENGQRLALGIFLITKKRIVYLMGCANQEGRKKFSNSFILDTVIKQYAGTNRIFDFEGSDISGVYKFFKSFGSKEANISVYEKNELPWLVKEMMKRRK